MLIRFKTSRFTHVPNHLYGYFPITLIRSYKSRKNLNKDYFVLMLESIISYHIKREELYFIIPFLMQKMFGIKKNIN